MFSLVVLLIASFFWGAMIGITWAYTDFNIVLKIILTLGCIMILILLWNQYII